jgi:DNA (cytosine-5)-methyltransferase 1
MRALSLFSGIGGIDLACEWAGIETIAFCECEPFPQKVLKKHWPNIPIYDDVCTLTKERLDADGIGTIGIISAGYPCQPYSVAGEREGQDDDRALWPEVKRLLEEIRPRWFVGENVAGHVTLGLDGVLADLDNIGYTVQPVIIPAAAVGAIHRRDRVFILAHTNGEHVERDIQKKIQRQQGLPSIHDTGSVEDWSRRSNEFEPKLCRSLTRFPRGMDRLRSLGNAVVPQQIYPILAAIKQIDDMIKEETP